jgi:ABC-type lipoprotein release transport system permease subunit
MSSLLVKLAWRNVWRNRRRSLITTASVAFSVMVLVFTEALLVGSHEQMALQALDTYKVSQVQIHARGYQDDPTIFRSFVPAPELLSLLREDRELLGFAPRVQGEGLAAVGRESRGALIVGIEPELEKQVTPIAEEIVEGDYLAADDLEGALVGDRLLKNLQAKLGDSLALIAQTRVGSLGAARFSVTGVFHTGVPMLDDGLVYLHIKGAQRLLAFGDRVTMLVLKLHDPSPAKLNRIKRALLAQVDPEELEVLTWPEFMPELVQLLRFDSAGGYVFLLILLLVIAFGVLNTIMMAVFERTREFGVLLSLGTKPRRLFGMIVLEALLIALLGAAAGALLGSAASAYIVRHPLNLSGSSLESFESWGIEPLLYAQLNFKIVIYPTLVVLGLAVLVALWPAWRAARIEPVAALRST